MMKLMRVAHTVASVAVFASMAFGSSGSLSKAVQENEVPALGDGMQILFTPEGVRVVAQSPSGQLFGAQFRLTGYESEHGECSLGRVLPVVGKASASYDHGSILEWYVRAGADLEQGFTLLAPPTSLGDTRLELVVSIETPLRSMPSTDNGTARYVDALSEGLLVIEKLTVVDASGRELAATLESSAGAIRISIDAEGATYPIVVDPLIVAEIQTINAGGDAGFFDRFGESVDVSGDALVVGAGGYDGAGADSGKAYVFRWDGSAWLFEEGLEPAEAEAEDYFGCVAIDGDRLVVGAFGRDLSASLVDAGKAYVYTYNGTDWGLPEELMADDAAAGDGFGSVDIEGDVIVVGAQGHDYGGTHSNAGAAYVFQLIGVDWTQIYKIPAPDMEAGDVFGVAAISGDKIVVGARGDQGFGLVTGPDTGAAYVFRRTDSGVLLDPTDDTWVLEDKLVPSTPEAASRFGEAVAIDGDVAVIGACLEDSLGGPQPNSGAAYIFSLDRMATPRVSDDVWGEVLRLVPSSLEANDQYGFSVAVDEDRILVGAPNHDGIASDGGAVFAYERTQSGWVEQELLDLQFSQPGDIFGASVAIDCETAVVGAMFSSTLSGSAHVFELVPDEQFEAYCFGDETILCTVCPCTNTAPVMPPGLRGGCLNVDLNSCVLTASGAASVSGDTLEFNVTGASVGSSALLIMGTARLPLSTGCPPGSGLAQPLILDGLRCVGPMIKRLGGRMIVLSGPNAGTNVEPWGGGSLDPGPLLSFAQLSCGQRREFQVFYRDSATSGCGNGINTSNAVTVFMRP